MTKFQIDGTIYYFRMFFIFEDNMTGYDVYDENHKHICVFYPSCPMDLEEHTEKELSTFINELKKTLKLCTKN